MLIVNEIQIRLRPSPTEKSSIHKNGLHGFGYGFFALVLFCCEAPARIQFSNSLV